MLFLPPAFLHAVLNAAEKQQLAVLEGQLAWMVSIVGSVIRGRLSSSSSASSSAESQESLDGELSARVFGLLKYLDTGLHAQVGAGTHMLIIFLLSVYFLFFIFIFLFWGGLLQVVTFNAKPQAGAT